MKGRYDDPFRYEDIIQLPHPVSPTHPQMRLWDRAAQFAPFAALTGYDDAVREAARLTDEWAEPDEDVREELDRKLAWLQAHLGEEPEVTVTFFQPDERKAGGTYRVVSGRLKKIDPYAHRLVLADGTSLAVGYIVWMDCRLPGNGKEM